MAKIKRQIVLSVGNMEQQRPANTADRSVNWQEHFGKCMASSDKTNHEWTPRPSRRNVFIERHTEISHSSTVHHSPRPETTYMPLTMEWTNKLRYIVIMGCDTAMRGNKLQVQTMTWLMSQM